MKNKGNMHTYRKFEKKIEHATLLCVILLVFSYFGCSTKVQKINPKADFLTFELSCSNAFSEDFSIIIDSNRNYFNPTMDKMYYGVLADSISYRVFNSINKLCQYSEKDSFESNCYDCSNVAIRILTKDKRTIQIYNESISDTPITNLIKVLINQEFQKTGNYFNGYVHLQTQVKMHPPFLNK